MSPPDSPALDREPVFVDGPGWRRGTFRWLGIIIAVMLAVYLWVVGLAVLSTVKVPSARPSQTVSEPAFRQDERAGPVPRGATRR